MSDKQRTSENLALIIAISEDELLASGVEKEKASELSIKICESIRKALGGAFFYIPKGISLDAAIRDNKIWADFKGNNQEALAKKYDLTIQRVYQILAAIQKIKQKESQPDLFE